MDLQNLAGRYEIVRELGRGGMGIVYLARDPVLGRMVAIKTLRSQKLDADSQKRFDREARAIAQMDHPGIVQIFDIGTTDDGSFFVMSYVKGKSLRELMAEEPKVHTILELAAQVADALDYSHKKGIVHRDIKPENIMVFEENGEERAKLMDFGISLANKDSRITDANSIFGTLVYLAPESIVGREIGPGSDIYSLGAVLYECLVGRPPFIGDPETILRKIVNAEPDSPRALNPDVDPMTEALILNCLSKSPLARPKTAGALARALHEHAADLKGGKPPGTTSLTLRNIEIVGREEAWLDLTVNLRKALSGVAQLTLVEGEVGLGKTALLAQLSRFAKGRGATVLSGRFVERSDPSSPFQGFGEALGEFLRGACPDPEVRPREVLAELMPSLLALFPLLDDPNAVPPPGSERVAPPTGAEALDLIALSVARIADATPVVLLLEDLDQADVSLQALHYIYRRRPAARLHLVVTYALGEMEAAHPLHKLLKGLVGERRVSRISLGPLSESETGQLVERLVGAPAPPGAVQVVRRVTGGNPLFVVELVNSLVESGRFDDLALPGSRIELPVSLLRLSEDRIAALSEADRSLLEKAAVLGATFSPDLLCELDDSSGVEDRIDSLIERRVLREEGETRQVQMAFSSALLRDALYRGIPPLKRRGYHRRAADLLKARTAKRPEKMAAQLYEHLMAANDPTEAAPFAVLAARTALDAGSHEDAQRFARAAVEATREEGYAGDPSTVGEAMLLWARCSEALGDVTAALERTRSAAEEFATADIGAMRLEAFKVGAEIAISHLRLDEARATAALGQREAKASGQAALEQVFTQSLTRIEALREGAVEVETGAIPISTRSARDLLEAEYLAAEDDCRRSAVADDGPGFVRAVLALSAVASRLGRHQACVSWTTEARKVVSDAEPLAFAHLLAVEGSRLFDLGRLQAAIEVCNEGLRALSKVPLDERTGFESPMPVQARLLSTLAEALMASGRGLEVPEIMSREGISTDDPSFHVPWVLMLQLQWQHQGSDARGATETLVRLQSCSGMSVPDAARTCYFSSLLCLRAGVSDFAQAEAERGLALIEDYYDTDLEASLRLALGRALAAREQVSAAEEAFLVANRSASHSEARLLGIDAQLGLSAIHVARGRFLAAEMAARIATRLAVQAGAQPREAESHLALARASLAAQSYETATKSLATAREIAARLELITMVADCDLEQASAARGMACYDIARELAMAAHRASEERNDLPRLSRATTELSEIDRVLGRFEDARARLEAQLNSPLFAGSPVQGARLRLELGAILVDKGDSPSARRQADAVIEAGATHDLPVALILEATLLKVPLVASGGASISDLGEIVQTLSATADPLARARLLIRAAGAATRLDREQAVRWLSQAGTLAGECEAYGVSAQVYGAISEIRLREGDLNEALIHARLENELLSRSGNPVGVIRNRTRVAHCYLRAGDFHQAFGWIGDTAPPATNPSLAFDWIHALGVAQLVHGRLAAALKTLAELRALGEQVQPFGDLRAKVLSARLRHFIGPSNKDVAEIREVLTSVGRPFHGVVRLASAQADLLEARMRLREGAGRAALTRATFARDSFRAMGRLVYAAEADLVAGEAEAQLGSAEAAAAACDAVREFASGNSLGVLLAESMLLGARLRGTPEMVREGLEMAEMLGSPWLVACFAHLGRQIPDGGSDYEARGERSTQALTAGVPPAAKEEIARSIQFASEPLRAQKG